MACMHALGWLAFVVVMSHLPLAQIHHAVTGEWRAYYRWKEIRVLRRATPGAHAALLEEQLHDAMEAVREYQPRRNPVKENLRAKCEFMNHSKSIQR